MPSSPPQLCSAQPLNFTCSVKQIGGIKPTFSTVACQERRMAEEDWGVGALLTREGGVG